MQAKRERDPNRESAPNRESGPNRERDVERQSGLNRERDVERQGPLRSTPHEEAATPRRRPASRRAQRPAPAGVDPHPSDHALTSLAGEDLPGAWGEGKAHGGVTAARRGAVRGENDDRLQADKPPHWG